MTDDTNRNEVGTITAIEAQKRNPHRYNIYINGEFAFAAHEDIIVKYRIMKGGVLSAHVQQEALEDEERLHVYRTALKYIARTMRSAGEIAAKLRAKGYSEPHIAWTIDKLRSDNYLNDGHYATLLAEQRLRLQRKGPLWIRRELQQKGVAAEQIDMALAGLGDEEEWEQARALAAKRWSTDQADEASKRRKITALLQRRGFRAETIRQVMKTMKNDDDDAWEGEYDD